MTKTSFAHQGPGCSSTDEASTLSRAKRSTPSQTKPSTPTSQASIPPKRGRGRPRKIPPREVKNLRGPYKKYDDKLIVTFLEMVQTVTLNVRKAAEMKNTNIPYHTTIRYWNRFTSGGGAYLPSQLNKKGGSKPILTEEHTQFLLKFYDDDASATLKHARKTLKKKFGMWIILGVLTSI
ncbi:hypothetical protein BJV82DRAFT_664431 [Fennellomyces sp. T-0311]|nr:hypothetical protein BJV82DRAFT_664431 [Fennellomyces sp. T-0311]